MADVLVGCEAAQGFEPAGVVVGIQEELQVCPELIMALVMVALDGGVLERPVHPLDLTTGSRVVGLGQTMLDAVLAADTVEAVKWHWCFDDP